MTEEKICPECGSPCTRVEVDIGVGIQCGPWGCQECGWSEEEEARKLHPEFWKAMDEIEARESSI